MEARKAREKAFHDDEYLDDTRWQSVDKYYAIIERRVRFWDDFLSARSPGRRVLECGCGVGNYTLRLAELGAHITGIDLSETAIKKAQATASSAGLKVDYRRMDGEALDFQNHTFDIICGAGILHHLGLERSFAEIARTLKPDGVAVFMEPLGHNPLINLYRRVTPGLRTPDEHPIRMRDLLLARRFFGSIEVHSYHLLSLAAVPFRRTAVFPLVLRLLDNLDGFLFRRLPLTRRYAWFTIALFRDPLPGGGHARG